MIPINRSYVIMPSLGLGYLASLLKKQNHEVEILHCIKEDFSFENFEEYMQKNRFDVVGIQMMTYDLNPTNKHAKIIKSISPETIIVAGGAHPSGDPEGTLNTTKEIDYAFVGEAEIGFPLFIECIKKINNENKNEILDNIPGLVWREKNKIKCNAPKYVENLDEIDFPAWDLMDPRTYPEAPHGAFIKSYPYAPLIITRGCPFQCTFCAGKSITGHKIRKRSVKNTIEEIEFLIKNYNVKEFLIEDENFTLHKHLVYEFCNAIINKNLKIYWSCPSGVRLDTLNEEMLKLMEKSGCHSLAVGVEFGSQKIHDLTKKHLTLETIKEKLDLFKKTNIRVTGFFLMGIPGETKEDMKKTIEFAQQLHIHRAQFNNFMPLPGSEIYKQLEKEGKLTNLETQHFFVHDVGYVPEGMTKNEIKNMQRRAYLSFYLRPKILYEVLKDVTSPKHLYFLIRRLIDGLT